MLNGVRKMFFMKNILAIAVVSLAGCAANQLHGFQNVYYSYNVPQNLVEKIGVKFREHGLRSAQVARDNVGRIQLVGSYRNEDDVDKAFIIVQSIVGLKSTSPFYPENIKEKRWEIAASKKLNEVSKSDAYKNGHLRPPERRALIIGISNFMDSKHLTPIHGEEDALIVKSRAEKAGYKVTALLGKQATKNNIELAIESVNKNIAPQDSLFIYVSSHGNPPVPSHKMNDRKMSIAAYDSGSSEISNRTDYLLNLQNTSVPDYKIQELAQKPTMNTRVIVDTCYSGEILKGISDDSQRYILSTNGGKPEYAGVSFSSWTGTEFSSKGIRFNNDSIAQAQNLNKNATYSLDKNKVGYSFMTATSEGELSWGTSSGVFKSPLDSKKELKGSFFTQVFFEYLDKHNGHFEPAFADAREFTMNKVSGEVSRASGKDYTQVPRYFSTIPHGQNVFY